MNIQTPTAHVPSQAVTFVLLSGLNLVLLLHLELSQSKAILFLLAGPLVFTGYVQPLLHEFVARPDPGQD